MRPEFLALFTAILWASGSFFEKQGLRLGTIKPMMGITLRTAAALVILALLSYPYWKDVPKADTKSLLYVILGGGVLAGALGMACYYAALSKGDLGKVMVIAFSFTPCAGALISALVLKEPLGLAKLAGITLCVSGVLLLLWPKS